MPRRNTPLNAAKQIKNVLEKMKDNSYNQRDFMKFYLQKTNEENSPKYSTEIAKCLKDNNCFTPKGDKVTLTTTPSIDVIKDAIEKAKKTRGKTIDKIPQLKYSVKNSLIKSNVNLIPKINFLDSISTIEIIDYIRNNRGIIIVNDKFYEPI